MRALGRDRRHHRVFWRAAAVGAAVTVRTLRIGIDPGVTTGLAVWSWAPRMLVRVGSMLIHEAMREVDEFVQGGKVDRIVFEDARLRTWFGLKGREVLQGAGSIRRDCAIWDGFLADLSTRHPGFAIEPRKPQAGATKWDAERFRRVTGWTGRTNEHARDAALLIFAP